MRTPRLFGPRLPSRSPERIRDPPVRRMTSHTPSERRSGRRCRRMYTTRSHNANRPSRTPTKRRSTRSPGRPRRASSRTPPIPRTSWRSAIRRRGSPKMIAKTPSRGGLSAEDDAYFIRCLTISLARLAITGGQPLLRATARRSALRMWVRKVSATARGVLGFITNDFFTR